MKRSSLFAAAATVSVTLLVGAAGAQTLTGVPDHEIEAVRSRLVSDQAADPLAVPTMFWNSPSRSWSGTKVQVANDATHPVTVLLELIGPDGKALGIPWLTAEGNLAGNYSALSGVIPAKGVGLAFTARFDEARRTGWLRITSSDPSAVSASLTLTTTEGGTLNPRKQYVSTEPYRYLEATLVPPSRQEARTEIALVNPSSQPQEFFVTLWGTRGENLCEGSLLLQALARLSFDPAERFGCAFESGQVNINAAGAGFSVHAAVTDNETGDTYQLSAKEYVASEAMPEEEAKSQRTPAATATCRPDVAPLKPRVSTEGGDLEFELNFERCGEAYPWIVRGSTSSSWFSVVNEKDQLVGGVIGSGNGTIKIRVQAAPGRKYGGTRTGTIYLNQYLNGKAAKTISTFAFTQAYSKL